MEKKEAMKILKDFYDKSALFSIRTALDTVIPELSESEDEKIRKDMIETIKKESKDFPSSIIAEKSHTWLAWLEKQAEHANFRNKIQIGDKVTRNEDGVLVNLSQLNRIAKKVEKQGETFTKKDVDDAYLKGISDAKHELEKQNNMGISESTKQKLEDNLHKALEKETPESWKKFLDGQGEQKPAPDWMLKFLDELRAKKNYFDWDEHRDIEGGILAIINWMNPNYFNGKDGEQKPDTQHSTEWSVSDFRTWQYIVSDVLTKKDGIGQYLDSGECKKIAKYMQKEWGEKLGKEQTQEELCKGEDYGIDGLYHAISILEKTLGKVDGYQSDDGILEHKCAINAVKEFYEHKPAWSEEDELHLKDAIDAAYSPDCGGDELIDWLKSLKDRVQP